MREVLDGDDVRRLQAFGAVGDFELDGCAFSEGTEAAGLDRAEVDEDVLSALRGDEAEALGVVEPFDGAGLFHESSFLCCRSETPKTALHEFRGQRTAGDGSAFRGTTPTHPTTSRPPPTRPCGLCIVKSG